MAYRQRLAEQRGLGFSRTRGGMISYNPRGQREAERRAMAEAEVRSRRPQGLESAANVRTPQSNAPSDDGGARGVLGKVLNGVGGTTMKALSAIDVFRRMGVLGIETAAQLTPDAFQTDFSDGMNATDHARMLSNLTLNPLGLLADVVDEDRIDHDRSNLNKIGDSNYGYGSIAQSTGNKWGDRAVGFAGDVALDPLTYVSFGAGRFTGGSGRVAAATKLLEAGQDGSRVGRLGVLGATAAERAIIYGDDAAGALHGLRFAGARIPGTGKIAEVTGSALARTRARVGDVMPTILRELRYERGFEPAMRAIRAGGAGANDAIAQLAGHAASKADAGVYVGGFKNVSSRLARDTRREGDPTAIFHALDSGVDAGELGTRYRALFDKAYDDASAAGLDVAKRQNFVPHMWRPEALKKLKGDEWARFRQGTGIDLTKARGSVVSRQIQPDVPFILPDGSTVTFLADTASGAVSAKQVNEKLGPLLGVDKVIEDDITKVIEPYIESMGQQVGAASRVKRVGALRGVDESEALEQVVDRTATAARRDAALTDIGSKLKPVERQLTNATGDLERQGVRTRDQMVRQLEAIAASGVTEQKSQLGRAERALRGVRDVSADESNVRDQLRQVVSAFNEQVGKIDEGGMLATEQARSEIVRQRQLGDVARSSKKGGAAEAARREAEIGDLNERVLTELDERRGALVKGRSKAERAAVDELDRLSHVRQTHLADFGDAKAQAAAAKTQVKDASASLARLRQVQLNPQRGKVEAFQQIEKDLKAAGEAIGTYEGSERTASLLARYSEGVAGLTDTAATRDGLKLLKRELKSGNLNEVMKTELRDGYARLGADLLGDDAPLVRAELARQLQNFENAVNDDDFFKVIDEYTRYFKTWATTSVGFHVRNGMGATFMNAADGVKVSNMIRGAELWSMYRKNPEKWLDNLPSYVTSEQANEALRAVYASGGGAGSFGDAEVRLGENILTNNAVTRASQRVGGRVEGVARMGMALDTILAGGTMEEAAARLTRVQFDYSATSKLDQRIKRVIPFWTFMSRNLPLQLQEMMLKPRAYQVYRSLQRNMGEDYENDMVPLAWQEAGAFKLTDGTYLQPDLAHLRVGSDLEKFTTRPEGLLESVNPVFRVPAELVAGKKFFGDVPFKENGLVEANNGLQPLGWASEQLRGTPDGAVDERLAYAVRQLVPLLGKAQRLSGDDEYYKDRQLQTILNELGIPLKQLTEGQTQREMSRRERSTDRRSSEQRARDQAYADFLNR